MAQTNKKAFIVLTGPFRVFESESEAQAAAKNSTQQSGTAHAVVAVSMSAHSGPTRAARQAAKAIAEE